MRPTSAVVSRCHLQPHGLAIVGMSLGWWALCDEIFADTPWLPLSLASCFGTCRVIPDVVRARSAVSDTTV